METRYCGACKTDLPEDAYTPGVWRTRSGGMRCRSCQKAYAASYYAKNRQAVLARTNARRLFVAYGITGLDYDRLLAAQSGRCAICGATEGWAHGTTGKPKRLSVDHCHETGRIRGLLCDECNMGIGRFGHDPDLLLKAIEYLANENRN